MLPQIRKAKKGYYFIRYTEDGVRKTRSYGKGKFGKQAAEIDIANIIRQIQNKKIGVTEEISAPEFLRQYLEYSRTNKKEKSYQRDMIILAHLYPILKGKLLSQITTRMMEAYKTDRLKAVEPATVNRELNTIIAAFNKAVEWEYLKKSPLKGVKKFKLPKKHPRFFSHDEIGLILRGINDERLYSVILLLLNTGMRRGELINLEWRDVDLKRGLIFIQPKPGWSPKDYEARTIPIDNKIRELLISLAKNGKCVFDNGSGSFYMTSDSLSRSFRKLLKKVGIDNASLHTLRHTYASYLVMAGVDLTTVQKLLGHSNIKTTMRYAHLAPEHLQDAVKKLSKTFSHFSANFSAPTSTNQKIIPFKTPGTTAN